MEELSKKLKQLEKEFREIPYARAAVIYGSAVRGDKFLHSDIDVAVFLEGNHIIPSESFYHIVSMKSTYDITPHSVVEAGNLVSDFYSKGFYEHTINHNAVIFDDVGVMDKLKARKKINCLARRKLKAKSEHLANICHYLLSTRRGCLDIGRDLPKYGLIKPTLKNIKRFKRTNDSMMREALQLKGVSPGKNDYNEDILRKFQKAYPSHFVEKPEFMIREPGIEGFSNENAYISSLFLMTNSMWFDIKKMNYSDIIKQSNELRKLIEFTAACINEEIERKIIA